MTVLYIFAFIGFITLFTIGAIAVETWWIQKMIKEFREIEEKENNKEEE